MQATPTPAAPAFPGAPSSAYHALLVQGYETAGALLVAFIVWRLTHAGIDRFFARRLLLRHPRISTYLQPLKSIVDIAVAVVFVLVLLDIWHINVGPAIWSAGAITAVLAFGAQWVVRDLLAGYSIFAENQFEVGDRIEILTGINSQLAGMVEAIGLRSTRIVDRHGRTVFIANGNIYAVTNLSKGVKRLEISVPLAWHDSVQNMKREILTIATGAVAGSKIDPKNLEVSLDDFSTAEASFRISIRTPDAFLDADESTVRERIAAALQTKGWLPAGEASDSTAQS
ncbi:MAG TPA: mechanosensitive ion channel domain-containing protein [Candidatus Eremiobacteraceae bacterium]|nr:mechanosensitive ion channel domain-containing protein [Candidatus Eremiobacteraceae bacterium]